MGFVHLGEGLSHDVVVHAATFTAAAALRNWLAIATVHRRGYVLRT